MKPLDSITMQVQVRRHYGTARIYPVCKIAKGLADLVGRKTFSKANIGLLQDLGMTIDFVPESLGLEDL